jgi:hypothetical protein
MRAFLKGIRSSLEQDTPLPPQAIVHQAGCVVLSAVLVAVIGAALSLIALFIVAAFDSASSCPGTTPFSYPATDMGCQGQGSIEKNKTCGWFQASDSCLE